jgi:hypothetical protein
MPSLSITSTKVSMTPKLVIRRSHPDSKALAGVFVDQRQQTERSTAQVEKGITAMLSRCGIHCVNETKAARPDN